MELTKKSIHGFGALAVATVVIGGGFFVAKPAFASASDYREKETSVSQGRITSEAKLASLKKKESELPQLKVEVDALERAIPSDDNIGSLAEAVVAALGSSVELETLIRKPPMAVAGIPAPKVGPQDLEPPFEDKEVAPPTGEPKGPPVLQQIPTIIVVTAPSSTELVNYVDRLSNSERSILVASVTMEEATDSVKGTIYAYAYANAPLVEAPAPKTDEDKPAT